MAGCPMRLLDLDDAQDGTNKVAITGGITYGEVGLFSFYIMFLFVF